MLKGLSFIPTPHNKTQKIELLTDLQAYHRRVKLETFLKGRKVQKENFFYSLKTSFYLG